MVISSSIGFKFSYPIAAPKMEMRGLVRIPIPVVKGVRCGSSRSSNIHPIPLMKGVRCVSSSNIHPKPFPLEEALPSCLSIECRASVLVPLTPGSMMSRKCEEEETCKGLVNNLDRGRDFKHFRVFLKPPLSAASASSPDLIIRYYIQTFSQLTLISEEEAVKRIYSVATRHYFAFGAKVTGHIADLLKALPNVCAVHPDEYVDIKEKRYPWDPFINGQALPYDGKYYPCFSNEKLEMASQETLPNSDGKANNGLGDLMAGIPNKDDV
ncbi:multiple organellar RNA editing factor 7, mitochondrial-like [Silene latifolia]|uniref:multiple organellar RNA editing factor 7, mitochondrial-like n=1 Tax=Silene latifolia TaxID=37657 RepID=UPI003D7898BA